MPFTPFNPSYLLFNQYKEIASRLFDRNNVSFVYLTLRSSIKTLYLARKQMDVYYFSKLKVNSILKMN